MPRAFSISAEAIASERERVGDDLNAFDVEAVATARMYVMSLFSRCRRAQNARLSSISPTPRLRDRAPDAAA